MKKLLPLFILAGFVTWTGCKKQHKSPELLQPPVSPEILQKIKNLGYDNNNVYRVDSGYLVEGDILLHERDLNKMPDWNTIRIANVEHYRTNNVITNSLPRTINVTVSPELPAFYRTAADIAIARYNALNLLIRFQRVSLPGGFGNFINIWNWDNPVDGVWASAGTPTSGNNPYNTINMNTGFIGPNPDQNFLASVIAHEIGHCIGFRHTDFMDRSFSCTIGTNEGDAGIGAVHIPGTPTTPDAGSWILACIARGQNRPFTPNDITALQFVY